MCTDSAFDSKEPAGAPATEIEVTPEMRRVGAREFATFDERFEDSEDAVERIFRVMDRVRRAGPQWLASNQA
jgi:hypothetical protein